MYESMRVESGSARRLGYEVMRRAGLAAWMLVASQHVRPRNHVASNDRPLAAKTTKGSSDLPSGLRPGLIGLLAGMLVGRTMELELPGSITQPSAAGQ